MLDSNLTYSSQDFCIQCPFRNFLVSLLVLEIEHLVQLEFELQDGNSSSKYAGGDPEYAFVRKYKNLGKPKVTVGNMLSLYTVNKLVACMVY